MSDVEIAASYGDTSLDLDDGDYGEIHSPFDLPAGRLFALLREQARRFEEQSRDYRGLLADIREMLDRSHTKGELKRHITRDPERFVEKRPEVAEMLARFRAAGKKTFLLTNSGLWYTTELLDYVLDRPAGTWRALFDAVVVDADKPRFFETNLTEHISTSERGEPFPPAPATVSEGGNASTLEQLLGADGGSVLYIGDNPAADCVAARSCGWRTAMVVPELATEPPFPEIAEGEPNGTTGDEGEKIFRDNGTATRFSRILQENADVISPRIEPLLSAGPDRVFTPD
jgi:HAD superfamily 5'-nucleotidase-like hydrolase